MPYETFSEAQRALDREETSCEALVSSFLERIDADNERLNAFIEVDREGALGHARYLDSQRGSKDDPQDRSNERPLTGLVLAVKDVISIRGKPLTCGSKMLEDFTALYNATVIERLRDAGAIFIGLANCDEFGMGSSNETSHFGPVRHPAHEDYVPGGSSGGSAAAVAAGMCHAALGSDTGGSIRQPAAFCGLVGLKPTYGRVSRFGLTAFASSFDTMGPMGRTPGDVAHLLNLMAGRDPNDATSAPVDVPDYTAALKDTPEEALQGLRIGLPKEYFADGLDQGIREMIQQQVDRLGEAGAEITEVSLPHTEYGVATYQILTTAEASSNLARYDGIRYGHRAEREDGQQEVQNGAQVDEGGQSAALERLYARSRTEGFGDEVKRRIMMGTYVLSSGYYDQYYEKAQRARRLIKSDFDWAFDEVDVLLTPTTPTPAFALDSKTDDPLEMYLSDVYTVPANLAGIPALSVPIGPHPDAPNLPVGLQLMGAPFDEALLLRVGKAVMQG